ncbi:Ff.00g065610.m01.CDS01 [Fusarium sp. VM40]|nr:Ff.00g065610.m01.CDS01 [Fusarium sp. VM40]
MSDANSTSEHIARFHRREQRRRIRRDRASATSSLTSSIAGSEYGAASSVTSRETGDRNGRRSNVVLTGTSHEMDTTDVSGTARSSDAQSAEDPIKPLGKRSFEEATTPTPERTQEPALGVVVSPAAEAIIFLRRAFSPGVIMWIIPLVAVSFLISWALNFLCNGTLASALVKALIPTSIHKPLCGLPSQPAYYFPQGILRSDKLDDKPGFLVGPSQWVALGNQVSYIYHRLGDSHGQALIIDQIQLGAYINATNDAASQHEIFVTHQQELWQKVDQYITKFPKQTPKPGFWDGVLGRPNSALNQKARSTTSELLEILVIADDTLEQLQTNMSYQDVKSKILTPEIKNFRESLETYLALSGDSDKDKITAGIRLWENNRDRILESTRKRIDRFDQERQWLKMNMQSIAGLKYRLDEGRGSQGKVDWEDEMDRILP